MKRLAAAALFATVLLPAAALGQPPAPPAGWDRRWCWNTRSVAWDQAVLVPAVVRLCPSGPRAPRVGRDGASVRLPSWTARLREGPTWL